MDNGNLGVNLLYTYAGNPTGVSTQAFNPPKGSFVIDTSTPALWQKTSLTDNSGFTAIAGELVTPVTPLTAFSVSANANGQDETIFLTPAGTLATGTFVFPTDATSRIGQTITLLSTQVVTALTVTSTNLTINGAAVTALAANVPVTWRKTAAATWNLIQPSSVLGAASGTSLAVTGLLTTSSPSANFGFATGAGGAVTQASSITTGVTLSTNSGQITTVSSTLAAAASVVIPVTNTTVAATDTPIVAIAAYAGTGTPTVAVKNVQAGSFDIVLFNAHASAALNAAVVINVNVISGVAA